MSNKFKTDKERIDELKTCLEQSYDLLQNAEQMEDVYDTVRALIRDTLVKYEEGEKFTTAEVNRLGPFDFLS
jgi:hypothetical protein